MLLHFKVYVTSQHTIIFGMDVIFWQVLTDTVSCVKKHQISKILVMPIITSYSVVRAFMAYDNSFSEVDYCHYSHVVLSCSYTKVKV